MYDLLKLLDFAASKNASDLHIAVGLPPMIRVSTVLRHAGDVNITPEEAKRLIYSVLTEKQIKKFEETNELDASIPVPNRGRVRINVFKQRGSVSAALRFIPERTYSFEELNLSKVIYDIVNLPKGLVLITGATGSGKTTTLASIIDYINEKRREHIITLEDPIEYLHKHKNCIVNQREIGSDTQSFADALRYILRQDPDIILIGEMRDLETMYSALTLAETGHLVFATLHTMDASSSINRIVTSFPAEQQAQIRSQLSLTLKAVLSQQLLPSATGDGLVMVCEIMLANDSVKNLIREMKIEQLYSVIQLNRQHGMQTMNQSLLENVIKRRITAKVAMDYSTKREELARLLQTSEN